MPAAMHGTERKRVAVIASVSRNPRANRGTTTHDVQKAMSTRRMPDWESSWIPKSAFERIREDKIW